MNREYFCKKIQIDNWNEVQSFLLSTYEKEIGTVNSAMPLLIRQNTICKLEQILKEDTHKIFNKDIKISHSILFFSNPKWKQPIHVDTQSQYGMYTSLNIPIKNCADSTMNWYCGEYDQDQLVVELNSGITYNKITMSNEIISHSECIDQPYVVRTNIPHSVINYSKNYRVMLVVRYVENIPLLEN